MIMNVSVAQPSGRLILLTVLQSENLYHHLDALITRNLIYLLRVDIQDLTTQRVDSVAVAADDAQTGNGKRLCTLSLREDESAVTGIATSSIIRIIQVRDTNKTFRPSSHSSVQARPTPFGLLKPKSSS